MPINRNNMDVVICVAKKDCLIVRKTIKYIRSCFCVEHIYLFSFFFSKEIWSDIGR